MLKIGLKDIEIFAYHGVYDFEKEKGGNYLVNVDVKILSQENEYSLENTFNYEKILQIVKDEMSIPTELLENLVQRIKNKLFEDEKVQAINISIEKLNPPMPDSKIKSSIVSLKTKRI